MSATLKKSMVTKPIRYDEAFITAVVPYGDADCIVRMFTKHMGRMVVFFKHGMRSQKGVGIAQAPALAVVGIIEGSHKLSRLVSCDIDPKTLLLLSSLKTFGYSSYLAELIEKFLPDGDPAPEIYVIVEEAFLALAMLGAKPFVLRAFELSLLEHCGYLPEMPCSPLEEELIVAFDPLSSRFLSEPTLESIPFSANALRLAKAMLIAKIGTVTYENPLELLMIGRIFQSRLRLMGIGPLKSVAFLKQIAERS